MLVHGTLARSQVNGPGVRAVVWVQGCSLKCRGCWNSATHVFDRSRNRSVEEIGEWILACPEIEGVTFSGGEPFQQAPELLALCQYIKRKRPQLSIGVFSGYTLAELAEGRWQCQSPEDDEWINGAAGLFNRIKRFLDFGVFGRFRQTMACSDKPLCGSRNQEVLFFTSRYSAADLDQQGFEVNISEDGASAILTGFPPA